MKRYLLIAWLLLTQSCLAAVIRWEPKAQDVRQVSTITVTGTWAAGDTWTLTINNKNLTGTVPAGLTTTANVADMIARQVDANNTTENRLGAEIRNFGGQEIPEFGELDADAASSVVTFSSATPGVPFTLTRSESTAGDGALGAVTAVTAATGKNWLSNTANYSSGTVPVDNDTLVFDSGNVDVLYALDHFRTGNIDLTIYIYDGYTGQIGLPLQNSLGYIEYRNRYFQFRGGSKNLQILAGQTIGSNHKTLWIDLQDQTSVVVLVDSARRSQVYLAGADTTGTSNSLTIRRGVVSVEPDDAPSATTKYAGFGSIKVGRAAGTATETVIVFGRNMRWSNSSEFEMNSGTLSSHTVPPNVTNVLRGGSVTLYPKSSQYGSWGIYAGGTLIPVGNSDFGTVTLYGGTLDCRLSDTGGSYTAYKLYAGSTVLDPNGLWIGEFHALGCKLSQLTLDLPTNKKYTLGTAVP